MLKTLAALVAVSAFMAVGLSTDVVYAQGCCKAGLCRIPSIPSSSASSAPRSAPSYAASQPSAVRPASASTSVMEFTIANPTDSKAAVEYVLDGKSYVLEPGMSFSFRTAQPRKIEFKRGAEAAAKYRVSCGAYEFSQTDSGWELYRLAAN